MVIVDNGLSKRVIFTPCTKTITAEGIADLFVQKVFSYFDLSSKIISDRGPQFTSKFTLELSFSSNIPMPYPLPIILKLMVKLNA